LPALLDSLVRPQSSAANVAIKSTIDKAESSILNSTMSSSFPGIRMVVARELFLANEQTDGSGWSKGIKAALIEMQKMAVVDVMKTAARTVGLAAMNVSKTSAISALVSAMNTSNLTSKDEENKIIQHFEAAFEDLGDALAWTSWVQTTMSKASRKRLDSNNMSEEDKLIDVDAWLFPATDMLNTMAEQLSDLTTNIKGMEAKINETIDNNQEKVDIANDAIAKLNPLCQTLESLKAHVQVFLDWLNMSYCLTVPDTLDVCLGGSTLSAGGFSVTVPEKCLSDAGVFGEYCMLPMELFDLEICANIPNACVGGTSSSLCSGGPSSSACIGGGHGICNVPGRWDWFCTTDIYQKCTCSSRMSGCSQCPRSTRTCPPLVCPPEMCIAPDVVYESNLRQCIGPSLIMDLIDIAFNYALELAGLSLDIDCEWLFGTSVQGSDPCDIDLNVDFNLTLPSFDLFDIGLPNVTFPNLAFPDFSLGFNLSLDMPCSLLPPWMDICIPFPPTLGIPGVCDLAAVAIQTISVQSSLFMDDVTKFDQQKYLEALVGTGAGTVEVESIDYEVSVGFSFDGIFSEAQAKSAIASTSGVDESAVSITTLAGSRRLHARRLATSVTATIRTEDATAVEDIATKSGDVSLVQQSLADQGAAVTVAVTSEPQKAVKVTTVLKSAPGEEAPAAPSAADLGTKLAESLNVSIQVAIDADTTTITTTTTTTTITTTTTTPAPTTAPTPASTPAPTPALPTAASASMMGANALVFVTAGVAMSRST
jgi:hypothetical protein